MISMRDYQNLGNRSGIAAFAIGDDYIDVKFHSGMTYHYSYASAGADRVEHMKQLALQGQGLCTYISKEIKELYEVKW